MAARGNGVVRADSLRALEYAVVDVETTGGRADSGHRITEIAVVRVRGDGTVVDEYSTLVNPGRPIPPFISSLTHITDAMVRGAPRFSQVAPEVARRLEGRVFVAHNVAFDWGFVGHELDRTLGVELVGRRLCTVRLARRVVPEARSRSLGALSEMFGIDNGARHRALGDARATVELFGRLLDRLDDHGIHHWAGLEEFLSRGRTRTGRRGSPTTDRRA